MIQFEVRIKTNANDAAFNKIKKELSKNTLLTFPQFGMPFHVHVNVSDLQLGEVISQNNKPTEFYSRKLTDTQKYKCSL